ncbi:uncharacterized protein DDB_G0284459 isoform X2 [Anabas testudineus]|uniref:uncharacterized protein DDB_G0284459 isoform X2 n=1 Tax=Anabas testudineus TaxID=64144 RepID=UPI000E4644C4|nr:uncharacterized protein DDB_G0284459 isoform X2 [Anabas testudineus]
MDQEQTMDFKALMAKFQDEELLQKQPKFKPVLPEKPKPVPTPQSPTYLPAGARPSLISSINQSLEGKSLTMPRVVFKDEKKDSKMPLIQTNSKGKDKSAEKTKWGKDKSSKTSKGKLNDNSSDQKQKKDNGKDKRFSLVLPVAQKESTAELVPATPPPKATTAKKGFLGFKKTSKRDSVEVPADPILDIPSSDIPGPVPLIPVPSHFDDAPQPEISAPKALLPNTRGLPDSSATMEISPPSIIPAIPHFCPPPAFIPNVPNPKVTLESETPLEIETPARPISRPASQNEIIPNLVSAVSTPPPSHTTGSLLPEASTPTQPPPEPKIAAEAVVGAVHTAAVATPTSPLKTSSPIPPSPKPERPISALSALERAEDMSPGKRTPPGDQRVFNALEKARRKTTSPLTNLNTSYSITPPPEEHPRSQSPTYSLPDLPPVDYEDRAAYASLLKPAQVNGLDQLQAAPLLEGNTEDGSDTVSELLVVPPPPPKKALPDRSTLGPPPAKPARPSSVNLSEFTPPPPVEEYTSSAQLPVSAEVQETDATDVQESNDAASDANSPEFPVLEWGNDTGADTRNGQNFPEYYSNEITAPEPEVQAESSLGDEYQVNPLVAGSDAEVGNNVYESTENVYEDINTSANKKKGKTEGGKKRKGPPKNPYAEAAQETKEEKTKTGRFGKSDKKVSAEGPEEKELKKKERQRLEKEKKELKEKQEREKKEQKEREKKENEIKKKFKITGEEDALYQAKVTVTTKGRKNDLPVKDGDIVSIIRTTSCPKGKWLARDSSNNYGYVAVDHVELDIQEMVELGKKTAINRKSVSSVVDGEATSTGSRASNHYPAESFSEDSEEWTVDEDDEALTPAHDTVDFPALMGHSRTFSMPDMGNNDLTVNHQHSHSDISAGGPHVHAKHDALQKLATFFHSPKPVDPAVSSAEETGRVLEEAVHIPEDNSTKDLDFEHPEMLILPPPDLYA